MRISTQYQFGAYNDTIGQAEQKYFDAQQQVATGRRINSLHDDPYGVSSLVTLNGLQANAAQYASNLGVAKTFLSFTDNALQQTNTLLTSAYQVAVQGANGTNDQSARNALVDQVTQLQQQLVTQANAQGANGEYIFAGQKTDVTPYSVSGNTLTYAGDKNSINVQASPTDTIAINSQVSDLYVSAYQKLEDLKTNLQNGSVATISSQSIADLQDLQKQFSAVNGDVGGRLQTVANMNSDAQRRITDLTANISSISDVDMASAITNYQSAQNAYQAALSSVGHLSQMSLVNFIQ